MITDIDVWVLHNEEGFGIDLEYEPSHFIWFWDGLPSTLRKKLREDIVTYLKNDVSKALDAILKNNGFDPG